MRGEIPEEPVPVRGAAGDLVDPPRVLFDFAHQWTDSVTFSLVLSTMPW